MWAVLRKLLCFHERHTQQFKFEPDHISMVCAGCERQTTGWDLRGAKPRLTKPFRRTAGMVPLDSAVLNLLLKGERQ